MRNNPKPAGLEAARDVGAKGCRGRKPALTSGFRNSHSASMARFVSPMTR